MFIQTEPTPNPASLKFLPGRTVMPSGTADFPAADKAESASPLASRLFEVDGVTGVFLGSDFITITKASATEWQDLKPMVLAALVEHFVSGDPNIYPEKLDEAASGDDGEVVQRIKELLDTRVRPAVARDGGDIIFRDYREGVVYLRMQGSCSGCPSATATLKNGIENLLRHFIPQVTSVRAVD